MKKVLALIFVSLLLVSASMANVFIGSRQAGMGGTGVASSTGLNAVAYNPAGLMKGPRGEFLLSLGVASQGLDQISNSISSASDPAQFMMDNYSTELNANGSISGILGFNFNHIGISVLLPDVSSALNKNADTLVGSFNNMGNAAGVLTLGHSLSIPGIPIASIDFGANIKALYTASGTLEISGDPAVGAPVTTTQTYWVGSGVGFDVGARANIMIPAVTDFSAGIALRNLAQTTKYKPKSRTDQYQLTTPGGTPTLVPGTEVEGAETEANSPSVVAIGCAGTVPGIGLKFAADIESISGGTGPLAVSSNTITHLGVEYPLFFNALILRGGVATGQNVSMTTLGAKINIPFLTLEIANLIDGNDSRNTSYVADVGIGF